MSDMTQPHPTPADADGDVLASIRRLLAADRMPQAPGAGAAIPAMHRAVTHPSAARSRVPDMPPGLPEDRDAVLRRRLTGTLRPDDALAEGRALRPIPAEALRGTAPDDRAGLRALAFSARAALNARLAAAGQPLRLAPDARVAPPEGGGAAEGGCRRENRRLGLILTGHQDGDHQDMNHQDGEQQDGEQQADNDLPPVLPSVLSGAIRVDQVPPLDGAAATPPIAPAPWVMPDTAAAFAQYPGAAGTASAAPLAAFDARLDASALPDAAAAAHGDGMPPLAARAQPDDGTGRDAAQILARCAEGLPHAAALDAVPVPLDDNAELHLHLFAPPEGEAPGDGLRDVIREVIRQELHGELGGRFSRNLREVIRMELATARAAMEAESRRRSPARPAAAACPQGLG